MARILVVDDLAANRDYLAMLLRHHDHDVREACDGREAIEMADRETFDLIVTDVLMPVVDGFELVRLLRESPARHDTAVMFYTAHYAERDARELAQAGGVAAVLIKPTEPEIILDTVNSILSRRQPPPEPLLPGDFDRAHLRLVTDKLSEKASDLFRANARLRALVNVGLELASERDGQRLLRSVAESARELFAASYVTLGMLDRQHRAIDTIIVAGTSAIGGLRIGSEPPEMFHEVLARRGTLRGVQAGAGPLALPAGHPPVDAFLVAPLASPADVYGWIFLAGNEGRPFSEEDEQLLVALAGQAGRIFENGYFFSLAQRRADALEQEVAQRLAVEEELRAERDRLRAADERIRFVMETAHVGIWDADYRTGVVRWSEILEKQFGLEPGTFAGTFDAFIDRVHPEDRDSMLASMKQAADTGDDFWLQHRTVWPDGQTRWLSTRGRTLLDAERRPLRAVGIVLDVTERRALEEQYQQAQKMEAIGRLAGGIAHDFNNLLTSILGYCELLLTDTPPADPRRHDITEIAHAGNTAATLTRQLLAFSRKQIIEPRVLDINTIVDGMRSMIARLIGEDIKVVVSLGPGPLLVRADRGHIEQIVMNLAVNARDAMPDGGILTIDTMAVELDPDYVSTHFDVTPGAHVALNVTDNGVGMTKEVQSRLFEPFFTTKEVGKGTGLGLATVHGIVKRFNGSIGVYSELGRGTTFKVYLPRIDGVAPDADPPSEPAAIVAPACQTVLVVEDADGVRELTRRLLERIGYTAVVAANADEARLHLTSGTPIDVVLTDVVMPGASGPELTDSLLAMRPSLKVIYMSGYTEEAIVQHGMLKPGLAFLHKPFNSKSLARKLSEVLGK